MSRRKRVPSLAPKVGDVSPGEYNWREQFGMLDAADGYVTLDVGKVRGVVTALASALEALKPLAEMQFSPCVAFMPDHEITDVFTVGEIQAARAVLQSCEEMIR